MPTSTTATTRQKLIDDVRESTTRHAERDGALGIANIDAIVDVVEAAHDLNPGELAAVALYLTPIARTVMDHEINYHGRRGATMFKPGSDEQASDEYKADCRAVVEASFAEQVAAKPAEARSVYNVVAMTDIAMRAFELCAGEANFAAKQMELAATTALIMDLTRGCKSTSIWQAAGAVEA